MQMQILVVMPILMSLSASSQVMSNSCAIIVGYHDEYSSHDYLSNDNSSSFSYSITSNEVVEEVLEQNFQLQKIEG